MERLTQWVNDREKRYAIPQVDIRSMGYEKCCTRLAEYEDLGMTPEQVKEMQMDWVAMKAAWPRWIPVAERLPEERDSIFAKLKGTNEWIPSMFEKKSQIMLVTAEDDSSKRRCIVAKTLDGEWDSAMINPENDINVIAWMPFPEPYMEDIK